MNESLSKQSIYQIVIKLTVSINEIYYILCYLRLHTFTTLLTDLLTFTTTYYENLYAGITYLNFGNEVPFGALRRGTLAGKKHS